MTKLIRKNIKFIWNNNYEKVFQDLKERLTTATVLTLPVPGGKLVVYTDACGTGLGRVMMHEGKVIAYSSR